MSKENELKVKEPILHDQDIDFIRELIQSNPSWSRRRLP